MTLADYLAQLERRAAEAETIGATAPVAGLYRAVLTDLRPFADGNGAATSEHAPERWLTAKQVGQMVGMSARWAYDHKEQFGGVSLSRRCTRFPESRVRRHLERRR